MKNEEVSIIFEGTVEADEPKVKKFKEQLQKLVKVYGGKVEMSA